LGLEALESRQVLSGVLPTDDTQYMLELVNNVRTKPAEAAERLLNNVDPETQATLRFYGVDAGAERAAVAGTAAKAPLAWSDQLAAAAQSHSQDMADRNFQSHEGSDGSKLETRLDRAGYSSRASAAENAFAYAKSSKNAMQAFLFDWGVDGKWHRKTLLEPETSRENQFTEIGIGVADKKPGGTANKVVTQNLARPANPQQQILGVVFDDRDGDRFYTPGEGSGGVTVQITKRESGETREVQTWSTGGYQLPVERGNYTVEAKVSGRATDVQNVTVTRENVKVDFQLGKTVPVSSLARSSVVTPVKPVRTTTSSTPTPAPTVPTRRPRAVAAETIRPSLMGSEPVASPAVVKIDRVTTVTPASVPTIVPKTRAEELVSLIERNESVIRTEVARVQGRSSLSAEAIARAEEEASKPSQTWVDAPAVSEVPASSSISSAVRADAFDSLFGTGLSWTAWRTAR
jgi:hypothetical protein